MRESSCHNGQPCTQTQSQLQGEMFAMKEARLNVHYKLTREAKVRQQYR
jgi:hypothetical protein